MKITIEHNGVKRSIEGTGFNICASPEDLRTIADAITRADMQGYGWLQIRDPKPDEHAAGPNSAPLSWAERASRAKARITSTADSTQNESANKKAQTRSGESPSA